MRIVTRADFDSIASAVLLYAALDIDRGIKWVEPGEMQKRTVTIAPDDIIANLPFAEGCLLWFDHHFSNRIDLPFNGLYRLAPSAAGLIHEYYRDHFSRDFKELVEQADKIDSADLTYDEVICPEKYPYLLLSMTIIGYHQEDEPYWNELVHLLWKRSIGEVMQNARVAERGRLAVQDNRKYKKLLKRFTKTIGPLSVTDFRALDTPPSGNRFLAYSLFPEAVVNMKICYDANDRNTIRLSVGHSIFNRNCHVNVGDLLSLFEGGGHAVAGACSFDAGKADDYIPRIIDILVKNRPGGAA